MTTLRAIIVIFVTLAWGGAPSWSGAPSWGGGDTDYSKLAIDPKAKNIMEFDIPDEHPTQFDVGRFEEKVKAKDFEKMSKKKLRRYQRKHPCPLVVDDKGNLRITDEQHRASAFTLAEHHSVLRALRKNGEATMYGYIRDSYPVYLEESKKAGKEPLSIEDWMTKNNYVFLEDRGKLRPYDELPAHVTDMGNDAYRSLAGLLENEAYDLKPGVYFAQFKVADWLREHLRLTDHEIDELLKDPNTRKKLLKQTSRLLRSPLAAKEPWALEDDLYTKNLPACVIGKVRKLID